MKNENSLICAIILLILPLASIWSQSSDTVYVTNTGTAYHLDGCTFLRQSKIPLHLVDAVRSGYIPCSRCNPPTLDITNEENQLPGQTLYRVNVAGLKNSSEADIMQMIIAEVVGHVDGDTVRVRIPNPPEGLSAIETIRLLGVDTPETVHPNREVERFGKEASEFTKSALLGKTVYLAFDWDLRDRYSRLLAYIYTDQGQCFNATLIREGYGHAYLRYPFQFMDEFRALEQEARIDSSGLWDN